MQAGQVQPRGRAERMGPSEFQSDARPPTELDAGTEQAWSVDRRTPDHGFLERMKYIVRLTSPQDGRLATQIANDSNIRMG